MPLRTMSLHLGDYATVIDFVLIVPAVEAFHRLVVIIITTQLVAPVGVVPAEETVI